MQRYRERVVDARLRWLLDHFAAVAIEGPRSVGKTSTATRLARTTYRFDDPVARDAAQLDPRSFLSGEEPILLDEWQQAPRLWDAVRRAVDDDGRPARFLLTGSASTDAPTHSGAGRILTLRMRPMTLSERGIGEERVSLRALASGQHELATGPPSQVRLEDYARSIITSGFPALVDSDSEVAKAWLDGYLSRVATVDLPEAADTDVRAPGTFRRWLTAYAAASGTTASYESIRDAATPGEDSKPSRATTLRYRDALERLWLVEEQPAWLPVGTRLHRLGKAAKHHVADPGLAARLLGLSEDALRRDAATFGRLFESLVTHTCRVHAEPLGARVAHFRTRGGEREVDVIVELDDGRVLAIEAKLGADVDRRDVRHLLWLREELGDRVADLVVVTTGLVAHRRPDGVAVVPLALLGP